MKGKTCVITGATSGLGRATALALARMGADVLLVGRNVRAGTAIAERLRTFPGAGRSEFLPGDLSSLDDVRRLAAVIRRQASTLDVLVNNAGARFDSYQTTIDGLERTFATNHLGHFLLTALLLDLLLRPPAARVVSVASGAHAEASSEGQWMLGPESYDRKSAYAKSKLANVLFAYELARRVRGTTVTSNALDPGGVATSLGRNNGLTAWLRHLTYYALKRELQRPRRAAETIVYLAAAVDVAGESGKYFRELKEASSSPASHDRRAAGRLWELSVRLTGLDASLGRPWEILEPARRADL